MLDRGDFLTLPVIRSLNENVYGIFIIGPSISVARFSRFCTQYFAYPQFVEASKDRVLVEYINAVSRDKEIDIIIPLDLDSTLWIAKNKHQLVAHSLLVSEPDVLLRLHNKWELTKVLDDISVRYPKTVLIEDKRSLADELVEYPFIVKPLDQDSGRGIEVIYDAMFMRKYCKQPSGNIVFPILAQSFIDGSDVDMSILAVEGKIVSWTIQRWISPGLLGFVADQEIYAIGEKIVVREKYSGFLHIDMRINEQAGKVYVLECNPRAWGTMNASILAGVNFIADAIHCSFHEPIASQIISKEAYATFRKSFMTVLMKPWSLQHMSLISKKDFLAVFSDPSPYFLLAWKFWWDKVTKNGRLDIMGMAYQAYLRIVD